MIRWEPNLGVSQQYLQTGANQNVPKFRGKDLEGRVLTVAPEYRAANPRVPYTHGWLAFEILRRATKQQLTTTEYERRLYNPEPTITALAARIPGVRDAYQNLKHIRCDIARGAVLVSPSLPEAWFKLSRCGKSGA